MIDYKFPLYFLFTFIACFFHLFGTYFFLLSEKGENFAAVIFISILIGAMASVIRIPTNAFLGEGLSVVYMEMIYLFLLFLATIIYTKFIAKEHVQLHTYVILATIISLLLLNEYMKN
jgi:hypothetical protein